MKTLNRLNILLLIGMVCLFPCTVFGQAKQAKKIDPSTIRDPAIRILLQTKVETPVAKMQVVETLLEFDRADLAKSYVQDLNGGDIDPQTASDLVGKFGSVLFLELKTNERLKPEGATLAEKVLAGAKTFNESDARVAELMAKVTDPSVSVRTYAARQIRFSGAKGVQALLQGLAVENQDENHKHIRRALISQGQRIYQSLLPVLQTKNMTLKENVIRILGNLRLPASINAFLLAEQVNPGNSPEVKEIAKQAYTVSAAAPVADVIAPGLLYQYGVTYLRHVFTIETNLDGLVEVWEWDDAGQTLQASEKAPDVVFAQYASYLLTNAAKASSDKKIALVAHAASLEFEGLTNGLDQPIKLDAPAAQAYQTNEVPFKTEILEYCLENKLNGAAAIAIKSLTRDGDTSLLFDNGAHPSTLLVASQSEDRRVSLHACEGIVDLKPMKSFPGSSNLVTTLGHLAATTGRKKAVVAVARSRKGQHIAGLLRQLGYQADVALDNKELFKLTSSNVDVSLVVVDVEFNFRQAKISIRKLRNDPRMAEIPIAVISEVSDLQIPLPDVGDLPITEVIESADIARVAAEPSVRTSIHEKYIAQRIARDISHCRAIQYCQTSEQLASQLDKLLNPVGSRRISDEEKLRMAAQALDKLVELSEIKGVVFDLKMIEKDLNDSLRIPALSKKVATVFACLGTASSQKSLLKHVNLPSEDITVRQAAAEGFAKSVSRFGTLLTTSEILAQYNRYNASEGEGAESQQVLSMVLDAIEAKAKELNEKASTSKD